MRLNAIPGAERFNDCEITDIVYDSRIATEGKLFVCLKGYTSDGHAYAKAAYDAGCRVFAASDKLDLPSDAQIIYCDNTRIFLANASAAFFGYPEKELLTVAITGTKGKTTISYMLKSIFEAAGLKTGVMGTTGIIFGDTHIHSANSTPESYLIHKYMRQMIDEGCKAMVIEASSQGFMMHRTHGITFDAGIFTNISPDHIGPTEHETFEEYLSYKKMLFAQSKVSVINRETDHFDEVIKSAENALTFSDKQNADFTADNVRFYAESASLSTEFVCHTKSESFDIKLHIPGEFSVSNALAAISASYSLGIAKEAIVKGLYDVFVPGRMELVPSQSDATVIIDYAHNELSVTGLFKALEAYAPKRIITVFGCGGNRSKLRRYAMGEIIARKSDIAVITSDNPRFESLSEIAEDIFTGMNRVSGGAERIIINDREEAIKKALSIGAPGDVILVIGKGHQHYEEINGVKYPFNERQIITGFVR